MYDITVNETDSCAVAQLHGMPDTGNASFKEALLHIIERGRLADLEEDYNEKTEKYHTTVVVSEDIAPFYLMFQALYGRSKKLGWVERFASYLEDEGLGEVSRSATRVNPGHGSRVTVFTWAVDIPAFTKWIERNYERE